MAGRAETALTKSMEALKTRDRKLADEVMAEDMAIDRIELQIESQCLNFLGLQQPVARDLRFLVAAIRISNYLERIGDHAVNVAQSASLLAGLPQAKSSEDLSRMAERTIAMLRDAVSSWLNHDTHLAKQICERDSEIVAYRAPEAIRLFDRYTMECGVVVAAEAMRQANDVRVLELPSRRHPRELVFRLGVSVC